MIVRTVKIVTETSLCSPIITEYKTDKTLLEIQKDIENQKGNKHVYIPNECEVSLAITTDKIVSITVTDITNKKWCDEIWDISYPITILGNHIGIK
jgi:hypothetical protein